MDPKWYVKRLASMGPTEIVDRAGDAARRRRWRSRPPAPAAELPAPARSAPVIPADITGAVGDEACRGLLDEAEDLLTGRWTMFGRPRSDMTAELDYFADFVNGVRAPDDRYSLTIDHRDEAVVGNVKYIWEAARHQHLTLLAAAHAVSGDERFAERIDRELRNYWRANPFLVGIHWTSGIELGLRLISWTWIRRLLDGWVGAAALFEDNPVFVEQLGRHHQWLASLGSHGSSANNHVIAEAAGQFVAASAFPLFVESAAWREAAGAELARELAIQTFPDGLNRELASDYHGFVLELALAAWVEAVLVDDPVAGLLVEPMGRAVDALNAVVDVRGRPHRQGDSDDAHGWLVDPIGYDRWTSLRRTGALVVEPADWWPPMAAGGDARSALIERCVAPWHRPRPQAGRRPTRPALFPNAGLSLLRAGPGLVLESGPDSDSGLDPDPGLDRDSADSVLADSVRAGEDRAGEELWCMFDHGPLGYLSTAAHGHADALAIEIRCEGVEVVADPGTYCYHGERRWRDHFRSTAAHATVTLGDVSQSEMAGPFLWTRKAEAHLEAHQGLDGGDLAMSRASHDGYLPLGWVHRREVRLDRGRRVITIVDSLVPAEADGGGEAPASAATGPVPVEIGFPLGPAVSVEIDPSGPTAVLTWLRPIDRQGAVDDESSACATVTLDPGLTWSVVRGSESPLAGWYSDRFGSKVPASRLVGRSSLVGPGVEYSTDIAFLP